MAREHGETQPLPHSIIESMAQATKQLKRYVKQADTGNFPPFIAVDRESIGFTQYGSSALPVRILPTVIQHNDAPTQAIQMEYWVDGDPDVASGIMHKETVAFVRDGGHITAYHKSAPIDPRNETHFVTSTHPAFERQAHKLYDTVRTAVALSAENFSSLYDYHYPKPQIFTTQSILRKLWRFTEAPSEITGPDRRGWKGFATKAMKSIPLSRHRAA